MKLLDNIQNYVPQKSIPYLLVCLSALVVLIGGGIIPAITYSKQLNSEIAAVKKSLAEQERMVNLYQTFLSTPKYEIIGLPMPEKKGIAKDRIELVPKDFAFLASKSALHIVSLTPELSALTKTSKTMQVNAVLRGDFMHFRDLLYSLNNLPYLESIDEFQIVHIPLSKSLEFSLKYKAAIQDK